ncbi:MAG: NAD-dependent epimerase/dehydratase family protein [Nitrospirae bacterium]|nr:NAD-dependent epimerase/dehydratase family protein [Nitrospirota bacterium]
MMEHREEILSFYRDKKVLVAGGAGFIGSNLSKELVKCGAKVGIIDGFVEHTGASRENIQSILSEIELYDSRIEDIASLQEIVERFEFIIDSMALTPHNFGVSYPLLDIQINLLSHLHLINALKGTEDKKLIYLGSRGQYGQGAGIITEETPQVPIDPQGINKMAAESYFKFYGKKYGFSAASLRIANCFGENQRVTGDDVGLVGSFIRDILNGKTVEIYGDEFRHKNLVYVKDLVKIILEFGMHDFKGFEAYNIAGLRVSLKNLLEAIIEIAGKGRYVVKSFPDAIRHIDTGEAEFSDSKIKNKVGGFELHDLKKSLTNTIKYFEKQISTEGRDDLAV